MSVKIGVLVLGLLEALVTKYRVSFLLKLVKGVNEKLGVNFYL